jgi:hypothetical protein
MHAIVAIVSVSLMAYIYKEESFKGSPYLHIIVSAVVFVVLELMQAVLITRKCAMHCSSITRFVPIKSECATLRYLRPLTSGSF